MGGSMKRPVKIIAPGGNPSESKTADIVIDKGGMRVENKNPEYEPDDRFIHNFICDCINMDGWYHSWHIIVDNARFKGSPERKRVREILDAKIESRKQEIQALKDAKHILSKWR